MTATETPMHLDNLRSTQYLVWSYIANFGLRGWLAMFVFIAASDRVAPRPAKALVATMKSPPTEIPEIVTVSVDPPGER